MNIFFKDGRCLQTSASLVLSQDASAVMTHSSGLLSGFYQRKPNEKVTAAGGVLVRGGLSGPQRDDAQLTGGEECLCDVEDLNLVPGDLGGVCVCVRRHGRCMVT